MATVSENIESQPDSVTDAASADIQGEALDALIKDAREALLARQREDGHWVYELEADATIPAEYIMLLHYLGEEAPETEARLANYLRAIQGDDGGWPLFHAGEMDLSATVKAYFALKLAGDDRLRRTWRGRARSFSPPAARREPTSSRGLRWRSSAKCPGARFR